MKFENGKPLSRAKAKSWREDVVIELIAQKSRSRQSTAVMIEVAMRDSVALRRTWIHGCPNGVVRIAGTSSPSFDITVTVIMKPRA